MSLPEIPNIPKLPNWRDSAAVTSYLTSLVAIVFAGAATFHVGISGSTEATVIGALGIVGAVIAQVVNVVTHRGAHKAVAVVAPSPTRTAPAVVATVSTTAAA